MISAKTDLGEERGAEWTMRNINKGKTCDRLLYFVFDT